MERKIALIKGVNKKKDRRTITEENRKRKQNTCVQGIREAGERWEGKDAGRIEEGWRAENEGSEKEKPEGKSSQ